MRYRALGKTGVYVSEIGFGGEWLVHLDTEGVKEIVTVCENEGINILDCWMADPNVRSNLGKALLGHRDKWYIQGHIGSTWQNGQYVRSREINQVRIAFEDLLTRLQTDYIDFGVIHYVDQPVEFENIISGEFMEYVRNLKRTGKIRHIGIGTHNPVVANMAARQGEIEMILFSINPAYDIHPPTEDLREYYFLDYSDKNYEEKFCEIVPERKELYQLCEQLKIGITVMKAYAGGRLFNEKISPFGIALTPVQCLHYALTRPAVASVLVGYNTPQHVYDAVKYESATAQEKDYASVLVNAPQHAYPMGQCTYCGHCSPCPKGIDIAMVNKLYDLAVIHDEIPSTVRDHYRQLKANASDCIGCKGCETRCPFKVSVVERMAEARNLFG